MNKKVLEIRNRVITDDGCFNWIHGVKRDLLKEVHINLEYWFHLKNKYDDLFYGLFFSKVDEETLLIRMDIIKEIVGCKNEL